MRYISAIPPGMIARWQSGLASTADMFWRFAGTVPTHAVNNGGRNEAMIEEGLSQHRFVEDHTHNMPHDRYLEHDVSSGAVDHLTGSDSLDHRRREKLTDWEDSVWEFSKHVPSGGMLLEVSGERSAVRGEVEVLVPDVEYPVVNEPVISLREFDRDDGHNHDRQHDYRT